MKRRDFVGASLGASLSPSLRAPDPQSPGSTGISRAPQLLELRRYRLRSGPMQARFAEYQKNVLLPALNRVGIKPVGAFSVALGPDIPAFYLLLPHPSADSIASLGARIAGDAEYQRAAASFRALPVSDPPYLRREGSLMVAFDSFPGVEVPAGPAAAASRVFELRTYESHNEAAGLKKIEMFEKGGEIAIFRRVGLNPVFFARNVIGSTLPSLTYMVGFADGAAREKAWSTFGADPEWVKLRADPAYADTVSNIHSQVLRPTDYSQV